MTQLVARLRLAGSIMGVVTTVAMAAVPIVSATQPSATTATATASKAAEKKTAHFIGHSQTKKYHKTSCEWAKKISKDNRVEFASAAEAKKAGFSACKVCLASSAAPQAKSETAPETASQSSSKSAKTAQ